LTTADMQNYAYDQQGNEPYFIYLGQLGLEVVTTTETVVLQAYAPAQETSASFSVTAALQAHQLSDLARARAVRTQALLKAIHAQKSAAFLSVHGGQR
jgi:hypothetical protein